MSRRGRCQCGTILLFERTAQGYKVRCPVCQAVVRLRSDDAARSPRPHRSPPPPLPATTAPTFAIDFHTSQMPLEVGDSNQLSFHDSSAPVAMVEMEVYRQPKASGRGGLWFLVGLVCVGIALAAGSIALVLSNPS